MSMEHRVREALDAHRARVRHEMDAHLRSLTSDLLHQVSEHQDQWRTELERSAVEARADWGHRGFGPGLAPTDMPIGASGALAAAVAVRQSPFVPPMIDGRAQQLPAFMRVPVGFTGVVVPLVVGGEVVAVLYADDLNQKATSGRLKFWPDPTNNQA